jgi:CRISPR type III-A-associated protein Csm2
VTPEPKRDFGGQRSYQRDDRLAPLKLPDNYLAKGYFDANEHILPEVLLDWARDIAQKLAIGMKTAQLRRFFAETRRIQRELKTVGDFQQVFPDILKLVAYACDSVKKQKAPPLFEEFMTENIKWASRGEKEFLIGFVNHFECVVGFFPKTRD